MKLQRGPSDKPAVSVCSSVPQTRPGLLTSLAKRPSSGLLDGADSPSLAQALGGGGPSVCLLARSGLLALPLAGRAAATAAEEAASFKVLWLELEDDGQHSDEGFRRLGRLLDSQSKL